MREGASEAFRREINRANSPVIPFVEILRTEREAIVDTNTEWGEADSLTGVTRRSGQIILTGSSNTFVEHTTGTDETLTDLVNPVGATALSVAAVQWGTANVRDREIHTVTARLDPASGGSQNVATWRMRLYRLYSVERDGERSASVRWHLQPLGSAVSVTAGSVQADVTFELATPVTVGDAPIIDPDVANAPVGDVPTTPTTLVAIWGLQADGSPATNVAWVTDDADDEKTISGATVGRYDLDTPTGGSYAGLAFRNTGTSNGVPRFALIGRTYSPVTVTFTSNPIDLGASPGGSSTLEVIGQGRARGGSITYEIHDGTGWVEYVDGDQIGVDRTAEGGSDLSGVTPAQTYDMRVTLTPASVGASPIVARIGVREIGQSEYVTDGVIIGDATWAVDPITGASEVPELEVTFPIDGRRDYRSLIEDTLATYHVGALQLRIWMGDPSAYRSNWLHIDDFLVDDYATVEGGVKVTAVSPLALIKRDIPEATGATITPLTYLADTPADIYDDLIASQLGVPARFIGQGLTATTPLLSREINEVIQGRDALAHVARIGNAAVISSQGRLKAVPFFESESPEADELTLFTLEETRVVSFSPGYRTRVTAAVIKYGWDNGARAFTGGGRAENTDAINNLGRGAIDFEEQVDEELCRWLPSSAAAADLSSQFVDYFGPGMKLVRLQSSVRRPWLEPGTPIAVESDQFIGRDPVTGVGVRGPMIAYAIVQAVNDVEGSDITAWIRSWEDIVPSTTNQTLSGFNLDLSCEIRLECVPLVYGSARGYVFDLHYSLGDDVTYVDMTASSSTLIVGGVIFDLLVPLTGRGTLRLDFGGVGTGPSGALFYSATSSGSLTIGMTPLSDISRTRQGATAYDRTGALNERGSGTKVMATGGAAVLAGDYVEVAPSLTVDTTTDGRPRIRLGFNVKDYGAVGDGITDDTDAIQAAIDAAPDVYGHVVIPGTHLITSPLTVASRERLRISGPGGIVLGGTNDYHAITMTDCSRCIISGLRIEGDDDSSNAATGIYMEDCFQTHLNSLNIRGVQIGVHINRDSLDSGQNYMDGFCIIRSQDITDSIGVIINQFDNVFHETIVRGYDIGFQVQSNSGYQRFVDNHVYVNPSATMSINFDLIGAAGSVLFGNYMDGSPTTASVYIDAGGCRGLSIIGNAFLSSSTSQNFIRFKAASANTNVFDANITGNIFTSAGGTITTPVAYDANVITAASARVFIDQNSFRATTEYVFVAGRNKGTATLANGTTSIAVTHGLGATPSLTDISVTPIEAWGAMTQFWVSNPTSTQFTINADQDPTQDVDFVWSGRLR